MLHVLGPAGLSAETNSKAADSKRAVNDPRLDSSGQRRGISFLDVKARAIPRRRPERQMPKAPRYTSDAPDLAISEAHDEATLGIKDRHMTKKHRHTSDTPHIAKNAEAHDQANWGTNERRMPKKTKSFSRGLGNSPILKKYGAELSFRVDMVAPDGAFPRDGSYFDAISDERFAIVPGRSILGL